MQTLLRKIGFEVEFTCPVNPLREIERVLRRMNWEVVHAGHYRHSTGSHWDLKLDSSCGFEIASPVIESYEGLVKAVKIVDIIKRAGGSVNNKCGLHVHVDMNGVTPEKFERVMRFMSRYENAFFLLADECRQNNQYCKKLDGQAKAIQTDPANFRRAWNYKHYWLNGTHLAGQGTLEFRLMASHLESEYIVGWVLFLLHAVDYLLNGKHVSWGQAKCASDRDLLQTMLGQAGFYGPFNQRDKPTIVAARKWALSTYTAKIGQSDRRIKAPSIQQLEALAEQPVAQAISLDEAFGPAPAADAGSLFPQPTPRPRVRRPRVHTLR
jgi:hypothetical protein